MAIMFTCCFNCSAPKRHPGCHDKCPEYKEEKAKYERQKEIYKKNKRGAISKSDFEMCLYVHHARRYKGE